ncbi:MAG: toll/interleukin-1 receptor domain-containing protein, partial [Deltaproteobacteria bacterium]|nr:toll/interleukin-1 receptor domain-containing protein [Deltaproteobacteria bacterium]
GCATNWTASSNSKPGKSTVSAPQPDARRYDVFLSYNSADRTAVEDIASRLSDEGIEPFLDRWELIPGESWVRGLEDGLCHSGCVAVFIGPNGYSAWREQEKDLALIQAADDQGKRVIPVLLPGTRQTSVGGFLKLRMWVDLAEPDGFEQLVAGIRGDRPGKRRPRPRAVVPTPLPQRRMPWGWSTAALLGCISLAVASTIDWPRLGGAAESNEPGDHLAAVSKRGDGGPAEHEPDLGPAGDNETTPDQPAPAADGTQPVTTGRAGARRRRPSPSVTRDEPVKANGASGIGDVETLPMPTMNDKQVDERRWEAGAQTSAVGTAYGELLLTGPRVPAPGVLEAVNVDAQGRRPACKVTDRDSNEIRCRLTSKHTVAEGTQFRLRPVGRLPG